MLLIVSLVFVLIVIFVVMIVVLRKIMTQNVVSATKHLDELGQEYTKKEEEISRQLGEMQLKSQEIINKAQEEVQALKAQVTQEAETERSKIVEQARTQANEIIQQADKSRQSLLDEIDKRIAKEASDKACELIQETLPEQLKQEVHAHWLRELIDDGFSQLERLHIPKDISEVRIASAFTLSQQQREILSKRLKGILGYDVSLKEEIDPKLVAGIVINIGSLVLDGSLKNKIQERVNSASA